MVNYPQVQGKAHEELDRVLHGRLLYQISMIGLIFRTLPLLSKKWLDGNLLVQLVRRKERLLLKEGHRNLQFSALLAIPHLVSQDDVYRGYSIPKDTIVVANSW